jgi:archaellum biogenesis ATPase FlaH
MNELDFENLIVHSIFKSKTVRDKVYPYLSTIPLHKVFDVGANQKLIKKYFDYKEEYKTFPTMVSFELYVKDADLLTEIKKILQIDLSKYQKEQTSEEIAKFFKKKLLWHNLLLVKDALDADELDNINDVPDCIREALSFSFDTNVGLDISNDVDRMYEYIHNTEHAVSTGIDKIDEQIDGGFHEKSLILFLGSTNIGKTLIQCAFASNCLRDNKNVLYISLEESEDKLSKRFLANLFDVEINDLKGMSKKDFYKKHEQLKGQAERLIVKEYAGGTINANYLRNLFKELYVKKNFKPDIVFIDYIGCMIPNKNINGNSNEILKAITEETRALAQEFGFPIVSGLQTNRGGFGNVNLELTDTAESIGATFKADAIYGIVQNEELAAADVYLLILLKSRFGANHGKVKVKVSKPKMRIYNFEPDVEDTKFYDEYSSQDHTILNNKFDGAPAELDFS